MTFEQYLKNGVMYLDDLRNKTIGDLIDFADTRPDITDFDWISDNTSYNIKSRKGSNISNNMKLRCIGAAIGLVTGLVAACYFGQETLTLIGVSGIVLIAFAIVGALLGAGAGYAVGKCLDKIKVTNMQRERSY